MSGFSDSLEEGSDGGDVERQGEILASVRPLLAADELVVAELCELGSQRKVGSYQELSATLPVQLHKSQTGVVVNLSPVVNLEINTFVQIESLIWVSWSG